MRRFWRHDRGSMGMVAAIATPIFIGALGLGGESGLWWLREAKLRSAADMAAHSAALELKYGHKEDDATAVAMTTVAKNGVDPARLEIKYRKVKNRFPVVEAEINEEIPRFFSRIFIATPTVVLGADSRATMLADGSEACVLALDEQGAGVTVSGDASVGLSGCVVYSNTMQEPGIQVSGSSYLSADCAYAVSSVDAAPARAVLRCDEPIHGVRPILNPYPTAVAPNLAQHPFSHCDSLPRIKKDGSRPSIASGRYCNGFSFSGDWEIEDNATIVVDGGDFTETGAGSLTGRGVTIILVNGARMKLNGQASLDLTAKNYGPYSGLLFFSDHGASSIQHTFNGGSNARLQGAIYLPTDRLRVNGGADAQGGCLHLIADEIDFGGNSALSNNCATAGTVPLVGPGGVRLME